MRVVVGDLEMDWETLSVVVSDREFRLRLTDSVSTFVRVEDSVTERERLTEREYDSVPVGVKNDRETDSESVVVLDAVSDGEPSVAESVSEADAVGTGESVREPEHDSVMVVEREPVMDVVFVKLLL